MNRRTFLTAAAGVSSGLGGDLPAIEAGEQSPRKDTSVAPCPKEPLLFPLVRDRYHETLFEDFLPFMERFVIDSREGGFLCHTNRLGENLSRNKNSWYEGRGIWVYSFLFSHFGREEKYLEVARKSVDFILRSEPKPPDELWPRRLLAEGGPLSVQDDSVYGTLFIAEGLAEFAAASDEWSYWEKAKQLVLRCEAIYDREDYLPLIGQTYWGREAPAFPGARILGHWMVFLRLATQMLRQKDDAEIERIADRCVDAIRDFHHNTDFDLTNELIGHDLTRPENDYSQLVYTGHAIETYWMLMDEALRRKDDALWGEAARRFRRHCEVAWDDVYGGFWRNLQNVRENIWSLDKVLWAQEEVLIGSLLVFEQTGEVWARDLFDRTFEYVWERFRVKERGFPLWSISGDRQVSFEADTIRVENFHHPRHLMLNLLTLERLTEKVKNPPSR